MPSPCPLARSIPLPRRMMTPMRPTITPATRRRISFSSPAAVITTTVQRRGGVEDRGKRARDIGLAGDGQRERQHVVEERDEEERLPAAPALRKRQTSGVQQ